MAVYMKVPYAIGSVTADGYKDWINLDSIEVGVTRSIAMEHANLSDRGSGVPKFTEFSVLKETEDASPGIFGELVNGSAGHKIEVVVVDASDKPREIVRYTFSDAMATSYEITGMGNTAYEKLSFAYSEIEMKFTPRQASNTGSSPKRVHYDLK